MATAAEPRPAELPLPGGRRGATVRLHPLLCGRSIAPPAYLMRESGRLAGLRGLGVGVRKDAWLPIPIVAFLVEHPGAGPVLVDTGLHPSVAVKPAESLGRVGTLAFRDLEMEAGQALPAQLRGRGIDPARVGTVVMTHLHVDHASGISEFPAATFVVSRAEWDAATTQGRLHGYSTRQFDHAFDYRLLDFDGSDADSFATFGRSFDVFGDGSVRLVFTPGHTAGHFSVILRCKDQDVFVVGDAAYTLRTIEETALPFHMTDEHRFRRSLREIQLYLKNTPDTVVIPGHDMPAFRRLQSVYE
jgi:N-acyl homoserine lactone hydrolase